MMLERKYFKPKSLSWWASLVPILLGVTVAAEPLHDLSEVVLAIKTATGGASPYVMINAGLAGIGIRGKLGE